MPLYERYIDDSNQGVVVEEDDAIEDVVVRLKDIADSILPGIIMEVDLPSNYENKKLSILICSVTCNKVG